MTAPLYSLGLKISSGIPAGLRHHLLPPRPHRLAIDKHSQVSDLSRPVPPAILPPLGYFCPQNLTHLGSPQQATRSPDKCDYLTETAHKTSASSQLFSSFLTSSSPRPHHREDFPARLYARRFSPQLGAPDAAPPARTARGARELLRDPPGGPGGIPQEKPSTLQSAPPHRPLQGPTPSSRLLPHHRAAPRRLLSRPQALTVPPSASFPHSAALPSK